MNIEHSYVIELAKGLDKDNYDSSVYMAKSNRGGYYREQTQVIAGREAALLSLLLNGRKLSELSGAELIGLFESE